MVTGWRLAALLGAICVFVLAVAIQAAHRLGDPVRLPTIQIDATTAGLLGVVIGAATAVAEGRIRERRLDRGAARATYLELAENSAYLNTAIKHAASLPILTPTWSETRSRLAASLGAADLAIVATAYMKLTALKLALEDVPKGSAVPPGVVGSMREVLERVAQATRVLYVLGWPDPTDRAAMTAQLKDHVT